MFVVNETSDKAIEENAVNQTDGAVEVFVDDPQKAINKVNTYWYQVSRPELIRAKEAKDDEYDVEEVG